MTIDERGDLYTAPLPADFPDLAGKPGAARSTLKWAVAFALFWVLLATLGFLQLFQITSEGVSKRALHRAVAVLTEIDPLIDRNYDDLQARSDAIQPGETVALRDFPLDVQLTREEATLSKSDLRELLLTRSADIMYSRGTSPLRLRDGGGGAAGTFSVGGITDRSLGFLRHRNHDILGALTLAFAVLSVFLALTLATLCRGFARLGSIGAVVLAASVTLLLSALGARAYTAHLRDSDNEYLQRELLAIGHGLTWIPIRNGIAFTVLGALMLVTAIAMATWADRGHVST